MDTEYLKKVGLYVLGAILSVGIIFYFGYHIWHSFTKEIETVFATQTTYQESIETQGYIFRTETLLSGASSSQSVVPDVKEGEHIRKGGNVAKIYSGFAPDTVSRIAEIEEQIEMLRRYGSDGNVSLKDTESIEKDIFDALADMRELSGKGNAGGAAAQRQNLVAYVGERAVLTGSYSGIESEISSLESEKQSLMANLGSLAGTVSTPVSGYYYSETDGYETVFIADELADMTLADLRDVLSYPPSETGAAGKTVTKSRWYLVCMVDESEKNTYKAGSSCSVKFKNTETVLEMTVESVLYDKEGAAIILTSNRMPEGFDFYRIQDVELVKQEYTGIQVPVEAVRMVDGEIGVYILDVTVVEFRKIDILYTTDDSYIVSESGDEDEEESAESEEEEKSDETLPLRVHDSIIIEGKGLYEGRVIGD